MPLAAVILVLISTFIHAGWNLLIHSQRASYLFLRITLVTGAVGLAPALLAEYWDPTVLSRVWSYLILAGMFQALYYLGLGQGYLSGDFTVVYPVARALPIFLIAVADVIQGHNPTLIAWLGMVCVSAGCVLMPLRSLRDFSLGRYWNRSMIWIIVTALATVGYTTVDNAAAEHLVTGPLTAARYGLFETFFSAGPYWLILIALGQPTAGPRGWPSWKWAFIGAAGVFGAYWLVLWSYQLSSQTSYVVALRQFSIVVGVMVGTFLFREPARLFRIIVSTIISFGVACIALAG
jgi:drug/metabolite transporter (DMT)-like permease